MASKSARRRLAAILAADMVGYSRLMREDEERTLARLKALRAELIDPSIARHNGRVVKTTGDGILVEFPSVVDAVRNAVEVQSTMAERDTGLPENERIAFRVGINLGDIIIEGDDIFGDGVNVAARLEALAEPGGINISDVVRQSIAGKLDIAFEDLGEQRLRNIKDPVRVWRWRRATGRRAAEEAKPPVPEKPSVAILPFDNMSTSREYEFLADGLTEDLITLLARVPGFFVIARNSSFAYKGHSPDIRQVGRELGVRYVVEGSLRPVGDRVRINVQLIEAETGQHLWADRFERPADRIHELQDDLTSGIIAQLQPELTRAELRLTRRRAAADMDAWDYYQQAHGLLSLKGWRRETFAEAADLLRRAIALDPDFALAHAYLSLLMALGHMFGLAPEGDSADEVAVSAAEHAMNIDGQDSGVLGYAGCALCDVGQTMRGIEILKRAVDLDPSNAQAWVALGVGLIREGTVHKGIEMLRHGMRISPKDNRLAYWGTNLAYVLFRVGKKEEALEEARLACRRDDKFHMSWVVQALILTSMGRRADAQRAMKEALRIRPALSLDEVRPLIGRRGVTMLRDAELLP